MLPPKQPLLLQQSTGLGHCSITWQTIMFSSGLNLFEALFPHDSTTLPGNTYGDASAGLGYTEGYQLVASTHSSYPNLELHSFPQDHSYYYPSYGSGDDFRDRFQIEDLYSQEFYHEPPNAAYENRLGIQDLLYGNCWEEHYSLLGDGTSENTQENALPNMQDFCLNEDAYASHYKDEENQDQSSFISSGFESWFDQHYKERYPNYGFQEPSNSIANLELYESIFGYWPCMSKRNQQMFYDSA